MMTTGFDHQKMQAKNRQALADVTTKITVIPPCLLRKKGGGVLRIIHALSLATAAQTA